MDTRRVLMVVALVIAVVMMAAAPAFATVNPGQHNGWEYTAGQERPSGNANGWIVDDTHNPQGNHYGWVPCGTVR